MAFPCFLKRPSETVCPILVDCFEHEKNRADLKNGSPDEGRDTASHVYLATEFGRRILSWQPDEESIDDPDYGTCIYY
jgi:hypothetical protein